MNVIAQGMAMSVLTTCHFLDRAAKCHYKQSEHTRLSDTSKHITPNCCKLTPQRTALAQGKPATDETQVSRCHHQIPECTLGTTANGATLAFSDVTVHRRQWPSSPSLFHLLSSCSSASDSRLPSITPIVVFAAQYAYDGCAVFLHTGVLIHVDILRSCAYIHAPV